MAKAKTEWNPPKPSKPRLCALSLTHWLTSSPLHSSLSCFFPHLDSRHSQSLTNSLRFFLSLSPRPLTSVVVAVPCPFIWFVSGKSRRNQSSNSCYLGCWLSSSCVAPVAMSESVNQVISLQVQVFYSILSLELMLNLVIVAVVFGFRVSELERI
ncbi:uncharacterized protein DS421_17g590990 [Arachis hypogaea]|nr:uncharacterized protein DS421_17g590990 [Arachis hypogaea]